LLLHAVTLTVQIPSCRLRSNTREQVNLGTVESLCSSLDVMVPGPPHLLHRGFVNFATGVNVALSLAARIFGKEEWQRT
jgi:hypothetical protein